MNEGDSAPTIRAAKLSYQCIVGSYYALLSLFLSNLRAKGSWLVVLGEAGAVVRL